jgi:DNA-binding transcriptional regulator YdaS (Cro superfamily)
MELREYLEKVETNICLAKRLNVAPSLVSQWKNGTRPIPVERMTDIEKATGGLVTRKDMNEEWARIWPELDQECACAWVRGGK